MAVFSVHIPPANAGAARLEAERVKFVADKFCWPALFFGFIWLIWHRMWWVVAGFIIVIAVLPFVAALIGINDVALSWIIVAALVFFAIEAAGLRRWSLERQGYRLVAFISGHDVQECERKFFAEWTPSIAARPSSGSYQAVEPNQKLVASTRAESAVIGVFPTPGAQK